MPNTLNPVIFKNTGDLRKKLSDHFTSRSPYRAHLNNILNAYLKANLTGLTGLQADSKLGKKIGNLRTVDILKFKNRTVKTFAREVIKPSLGRGRALLTEYEAFWKTLPRNKTIGAYLALDKPIDKHPAFGNVVRDTNTFLLLKESAIKNDDDKINKAVMALTKPSPDADPQLNYLVKNNIVTADELADIKYTLDLGVITLNNTKLIASLKADNKAKLEDLITFNEKDWLDYNKAHHIEIPEIFKGTNKAIAYARHLEEVVTSIFPTKKLFHCLGTVDEAAVKTSLTIVEKFLKDNPKIRVETSLTRRVTWGNVNTITRSKIRQHLEQLKKLSKRYSHLGIREILNDRNKSPAQKIKVIKTLIVKLDKFITNNPEFDLQTADFHPRRGYIKRVTDKNEIEKLKINWIGLSNNDQERLILQLKRYQRLFRIHPRFRVINALLEEGISSARQITAMSESRFVEKYHEKLGKDEKFAQKIYKIAKERMNKVSLLWANCKDTAGSRVYNPNPGPGLFNNLGQDVLDYVKEISGYQEIFGDIRFCECPECRSIYGPAAYFVDLIRFIETVIPNNTLFIDEENKRRRVDLKDIQLTCENTNKLVPYIELVNEIMENKIKSDEGKSEFEVLLDAKYPFPLPYNLHLERTRVFLEHFKTTLAEIYELFAIDKESNDAEKNRIAIESLRISPAELETYTTSVTSLPGTDQQNELKKLYGITSLDPSVVDPSVNINDPVEDILKKVKTFFKYTKLTKLELNSLVGKDLKDSNERHDFFINKADINYLDYTAIRPDGGEPFEELTNLTLYKLDRIHRFVRLAKKLDWSFEDLDWVLRSIPADEINQTALNKIAQIEKLRKKLGLPLEVLTSFWFNIKDTGQKLTDEEDERTFFKRIFQDKDRRTAAYDFTESSNIQEWDYSNPDDEVKHGLLAALEIYESDLLLLFEKLRGDLDSEGRGKIDLNIDKLSLLYRFSKLPKALGISVREFFLLWEDLLGKSYGKNINDVEEIVKIIEWINESDWSIYELHYVLTGTENEFTNPGFHEQDLRVYMTEQRTDTSELDKLYSITVSKESKKDFISKDFDKLHKLYPDLFGGATNINEVNLENETLLDSVIAAEIKAAKRRILSEKISLFFEMTPQRFDVIAKLASIDLDNDSLFNAVVTELSESDPVPHILLTELRKFHRYKYLCTKVDMTEIELAAVKAYPREFGIGDTNPLKVNISPLKIGDIKSLDRFKQLKTTYTDTLNQLAHYLEMVGDRRGEFEKKFQEIEQDLAKKQAHVRENFASLSASYPDLFGATPDEGSFDFGDESLLDQIIRAEERATREDISQQNAKRLSPITHWKEDDIKALYTHLWSTTDGPNLPYEGMPLLWRIKKCLDLSKRTGVRAQSIVTICVDLMKENVDFPTYKTTADAVLEITKAKYDEEKWEETYKPLKNHIIELNRDALSSYLTGADDVRELYQYLLVDPKMSSCFEISRIKQGISSLQLYFQRCLMNLENGRDGSEIKISHDLAKEWSWRKNYRVWEANRKVFLYPEDCIYPELRDNKSPQFKELEDELLQGEITDINVERAYKNYLDKFVQLANLTIAGAYYDDSVDEDTEQVRDVLHLIGRTKTQPHIYYYRRYENSRTWTPWKKIDLTINAEYVSPVYAFRRLFIFWVETHKEKSTKEGNKPLAEMEFGEDQVKATVKYSFYDLNKKWTQPQVLILDKATTRGWREKYAIFLPEAVSPDRITLYNDYIFERGVFLIEHPEILSTPWYLSTNLTVSRGVGASLLYWPGVKVLRVRHANKVKRTISLDSFTAPWSNFSRHELIHTTTSEPDRSTDVLGTVAKESQSKLVINDATRFLVDTRESEYLADIVKVHGYSVAPNKPRVAVLGGSVHAYDIKERVGSSAEIAEMLIAQPALPDIVRFERIDTQAANSLGPILFAKGMEQLLHTETQCEKLKEPDFNDLSPQPGRVRWPPISTVDFEGPYGLYYRELFFHAPFLIANRLNADQKFAEAQKWYHYIFNPTEPIDRFDDENFENDNGRFWRYLPFRDRGLDKLEEILTDKKAIAEYRANPFKPHAIARLRLNTYQKAIVMKYIDNLLDWGDYLFAQDSIESINEATNLYILAYDLLGKKPEKLGVCPNEEPLTYQGISDLLEGEELPDGAIPEFYLDLENAYLMHTEDEADQEDEGGSVNADSIFPPLYFCIPENELFLEYWDRVEDRLFKIRHCMNIKGIVRQLPLFQPPIDPMALVRAAASGRDISSVISEITAGMVSSPHYRFTYMIEKAKSLASNTQQLGSLLLSALEKKDTEELSQIRSVHEKALLNLTTKMKDNQLKEAEENIKMLEISKQSAKERNAHYKKLNKEGLILAEQAQIASMLLAWGIETGSNLSYMVAAVLHLLPNVGAPTAMTQGGTQVGASAKDVAEGARAWASFFGRAANMSATLAGFSRRSEGWKLQESQTELEIENIDSQIATVTLRKEIVEKKIELHEKNIEQNDEIDYFLKNKFTNKDLYQWMSNQLAGLYFQAYKMAYDLAKTAERAYQHETGLLDDTFIHYGHWDSLKKGLLAGERLSLELNQMELSYINQNSRGFEIEKTISLRFLNPKALYDLRTKGECQFDITEKLFDLDFPGHYFRKTKNVSISIPAIVGPYENVKATLTQLNYKILRNPNIEGVRYMLNATLGGHADVIESASATQQIAVSRAVNDSGMFELNFRDERYLPFEGTGAVSGWRLEMPKASNQIDYDSISDVVINLKYTALSNGQLRNDVIALDTMKKFSGYRVLSIRNEFSTEWHGFMNPLAGGGKHVMDLGMSKKMFPPNTKGISITGIFVKLDVSETLCDSAGNLKIGSDLTVNLIIHKTGQDKNLPLTFEDGKTSTLEIHKINNVDMSEFLKEVVSFEFFVARAKSNDPTKEIPSALRKKKEDNPDEDEVEIIDGGDYYSLNPDKLRNIGLVLVFDATLTW